MSVRPQTNKQQKYIREKKSEKTQNQLQKYPDIKT